VAHFKPLPPLAELQEAFTYDPETGIIRYAKSKSGVRGADEAGTLTKRGYRRIELNRQLFLAHRVAWALFYQVDPGDKQIDHVNGDKADNSIANLRLATNQQNQVNRAARGYFRQKNGSYTVQIRIDGKLHSLGTYSTEEEASKVYRLACIERGGEFAPREYQALTQIPR